MGIDVASYLSILLYRHNAVVVPGFGGFIATPVGATIDHASGMLHPPSKIVSFNEHLVINDGYLINYIRQRHGITVLEARQAIEYFVKSLNDILSNYETVLLPEIGKLNLSRTNNKIIFSSNNTNFNTASFGLPPLHYYPTAKATSHIVPIEPKAAPEVVVPIPAPSVAEIVKDINTPAVTPTPAAPITTSEQHAVSDTLIDNQEPLPARQTWYERIGLRREAVPALIVACALTFATGMYWYGSKQRQATTAQPVTVAEETRVNVRPQPTDIKTENQPSKEVAETTSTETEAPVTKEDIAPEKNNAIAEAPEHTETSKPSRTTTHHTENSGNKRCTVVIGGFVDDGNISRLSKRVKAKGLSTFKRDKNGMTLVGATFSYDGETEKANRVKQIRNWFGESAYILKK
jgi:hypothetical protein